jgi:diamine N-acetyltransferase
MPQSNSIQLRALEPSDVDLLYAWENDEKLWHLSNTVAPFSKFVLEQYIMNAQQDIYSTRQLRLMIDKIETGNKATIGAIDLFDFDPVNKRAGVGILLEQSEQKKGYASQALNILIKYCFSTLQLHQLFCNIAIDNNDSLELFKKLNFEVTGIKKDWLFIEEKWVDEYLLQLIKR